MFTEIIVSCIGAMSAIIVATIEVYAHRDRKSFTNNIQLNEKRSKTRMEMQMINSKISTANGKLTMILAKKLLDQKTNGDVEEAMNEYQNSVNEYTELEKKIVQEYLKEEDN